MRFAELDAVTFDANGTLVRLADPVPELARLLRERGAERTDEQVEAAFVAEAAYYTSRAHEGRDAKTLARLRSDCAGVFLQALNADLPPEKFAPEYVAALRFELMPGVLEALGALQARGLALAVVSNWDCALPEHLTSLGLGGTFAAVVTSAETGATKPDPAIFRVALERIGVEAARALHVGDQPYDEEGARAAGMSFAPAPLRAALEGREA